MFPKRWRTWVNRSFRSSRRGPGRRSTANSSTRLCLEPLEDRRLPATSLTGLATYGQLPLSFEANQGQTDPQVNFLSRGTGYALFLTPTEAVLSLEKSTTPGVNTPGTSSPEGAMPAQSLGRSQAVFPSPGLKAWARENGESMPPSPLDVLTMQLVGANAASQAVGLDRLPGISNYFIGNDPTQWHTNVPNFGQVEYQNVYPGVNLVYYGNQRQLEYDFDIAPGADPGVIALRFQGQESLALDAQGNLLIHTAGGDVVEHAPILYQEVAGVRQAVSGQYVLEGADQVGFAVGTYDTSKPLTIDPVLSYSTYLGGSGIDEGLGIAVDSAGSAYVTGRTDSTNFPTTAGAFQTTLAGTGGNAFVAKLNASGTALVYSSYLGGSGCCAGSGGDTGFGIAVDGSGNAYVTGITQSTNFPTTVGAFQTMLGGSGVENAFVAKLNPTGAALMYSTYLGGNNSDGAFAIGIDSSGNAYVTGATASSNFPTTSGAFQTTLGSIGTFDAFVTKLNGSGTALVYSTYLGGSGGDSGQAIALDSAGNAYLTGWTYSTNFPTANPVQATNAGGYDAFVAKLNTTGTALVYSTYLGGNNYDLGQGIAVDSSGNAYVTGITESTNFPTTAAAFQTTLGSSNGNAFVTKLNGSGTALVYSTYLGGGGYDQGTGIALDSAGNAYVTGQTLSTNFPTTAGAFQTTLGGTAGNAFVTNLNAPGTALIYSTYLGGSAGDTGFGIAMDRSGNAYVTGDTGSINFPTTTGAFQTTRGGNSDAFITKFEIASDHFSVSAPASTTAGQVFSVIVTALDSNNNTFTGYRGTVHFTSSDPQAVLPSDYTFVAADAGVHTFTVTLKTAGNQSITATDTATATITGVDSPIDVAPAAAKTLLVAGFPSPIVAGTVASFTVTAMDPYGNIATGYMGTVHFTSTDKKAALPTNYTFSSSDAGVHDFAAILETAGTRAITATDTVTKTITGSQSGIGVIPAAASQLKVKAPASSTAGAPFSITVTALDPYGNIATGYTGTVHFTSSDKKAVLPADYTFTVGTGGDNGIHTTVVTLKTAGSQTVTATDTVTATITGKSSTIKVSAAAVNHLKVTAVASTTAGTAFSITVTAQDAFNNTVTSYTGTIHFTSSDIQSLLPADYTFTATDKGVHKFSNGATLKTAGMQTVTATDTVTPSITGSASIKVKAAKATTLSITAPANVTHGTAFNFTVTVLDAFGNVATGYTGTVHFSSSDTVASLPANYKFTSTNAGVHTFTATLNTTGSQSLTATDTLTSTITGTDPAIQVS